MISGDIVLASADVKIVDSYVTVNIFRCEVSGMRYENMGGGQNG